MTREPDTTNYLWDRSGPPDEHLAQLERTMSALRHKGREPDLIIGPRAELAAPPRSPAPVAHTISMQSRRISRLPLAAMIALALVTAFLARPSLGPWLKVESREGSPLIGAKEAGDRLHIGQWLKTDSRSTAEIAVADIGTVTVKPNSRIRIKNTGSNLHRLDMPYGSIHAFITAPPRVFIVDTPAATAIDMGCEYTLDLDERGNGILRVSLGHVLLEGPSGLTSDVPMWGGVCKIRSGIGPGTPYFDDASPVFIAALERVDFESGGVADLQVVLEQARPKDALSLWHLIPRTSASNRLAVVTRLATLKPLPNEISQDAILNLEREALEVWFDAMRPF